MSDLNTIREATYVLKVPEVGEEISEIRRRLGMKMDTADSNPNSESNFLLERIKNRKNAAEVLNGLANSFEERNQDGKFHFYNDSIAGDRVVVRVRTSLPDDVVRAFVSDRGFTITEAREESVDEIPINAYPSRLR